MPTHEGGRQLQEATQRARPVRPGTNAPRWNGWPGIAGEWPGRERGIAGAPPLADSKSVRAGGLDRVPTQGGGEDTARTVTFSSSGIPGAATASPS